MDVAELHKILDTMSPKEIQGFVKTQVNKPKDRSTKESKSFLKTIIILPAAMTFVFIMFYLNTTDATVAQWLIVAFVAGLVAFIVIAIIELRKNYGRSKNTHFD